MDAIIKQALIEKIQRLKDELLAAEQRNARMESYFQSFAIQVHNKGGELKFEATAMLDRIRKGDW